MLYSIMDASATIRRDRQRAGLTQAEVAERAGTTQSAISRLERSHVHPSLETLERLAKACGAEVELRLQAAPPPPAEFESNLRLTPADRLDQLVRTVRFVREGRRAMASHGG